MKKYYLILTDNAEELMINLDELNKRVDMMTKKACKSAADFKMISDLLEELSQDISYVRQEYFAANDEALIKKDNERELKKLNDLQNMLLCLADLKLKTKKHLNENLMFDKSLCLKNIRTLLKKSDIKIGQIENMAHVRPGYLSIIEKENCTSDPCIRFITIAAKMLKVSVDDLLFTRISDLSDDEQMIMDFLSDVLDDTLKGNINFKKLKTGDLSNAGKKASAKNMFSFDDKKGVINITSRFIPEAKLCVNDDSYHAILPSTEGELFILSLSRNDHGSEDTFYEIYLGDRQRPDPICTTLDSKPQIISVTDKIIKALKETDKRSLISDDAKELIAKYRVMRR